MYFWSRLGLGQEIPLVAGQESRAAAPAQPGRLDLLDHVLRAPVDQHLVKRLVAADRNVLLDVRRIDQPAVAQHDLLLSLEEGNRVPRPESRDSPGRICMCAVMWSHSSILQ